MTVPALDALRSALPDSYVVLDADDRITHVSSPLHDDLGRWLGHVLWDHLPGAREVYGPAFAVARASGEPARNAKLIAITIGAFTSPSPSPGPPSKYHQSPHGKLVFEAVLEAGFGPLGPACPQCGQASRARRSLPRPTLDIGRRA